MTSTPDEAIKLPRATRFNPNKPTYLICERDREIPFPIPPNPNKYLNVDQDKQLDRVWKYFGCTTVGYITFHDRPFRPYIIGFYGVDGGNSERVDVSLNEMHALMGKHVARYAKTYKRSFHKVLDRETAIRLGLMNAVEDQRSYGDTKTPRDVNWVLEYIWLSVGSNRELKGAYYAQGKGDSKAYIIDLYTFQQWGSTNDVDNRPAVSSNGVFWRGKRSQAETVIEIDNWCTKHPGVKLDVHTAKSK